MIKSSYSKILHKICSRLKDCPSIWVITGSLGMALQGMDIEVHDIDIQTDQRGAYAIQDLLFEYVIHPVRYLASEKIRSHLGTLDIDGVKVEIMGEVQKLLADQVWEEPVQVELYRRWISFEDLRVPVLSLEYEVEAYRKLGRPEKAEKIKNWLEKRRLSNE